MSKDVSLMVSRVSNGWLLKATVLGDSEDLDSHELFVEKSMDDVLLRVQHVFKEDDE